MNYSKILMLESAGKEESVYLAHLTEYRPIVSVWPLSVETYVSKSPIRSVNTKPGAFIVSVEWHQQLPLLAVGTCTTDSVTRTQVNVFNHMGELISDVNELYVENNESTTLSWHPNKKTLVAGFLSGDIHLWNGQPDFISVPSPHSSPIKFFKWSHLGTRLISIDQAGEVIGWKTENRGSITKVFQTNAGGAPISVAFGRDKPGLDVECLAKKAVAGDEKALDIFSTWRPKTSTARPTFSSESTCCFIAVLPSKICYISETGNATNVANTDFAVKTILHHSQKDQLIVILNNGSINQYSVSADGQLKSISEVRLNDAIVDFPFIWIEDDLLACITRDSAIRLFDVNTRNTYLIRAISESNENSSFTTISYSSTYGTLCAGSSNGKVTMWKKSNAAENAEDWIERSGCKLKNKVVYCSWGFQYAVVVTDEELYILQEHESCWCYNKKVSVVQRTANEVMITREDQSIKLNTDLKIVGVSVSEECVAVWSGKTVAVYKLTDLTAFNVLGTFNCECDSVLIYEQSLVILPNTLFQSGKLLISTFQGTVKQNLDVDGQPIATHLNQCYLVTATIIGMLQVWDLSRREAKPYVHPKDLVDAIPDFSEVVMIRINCTGMRISLTIANTNLIPLPCIYVWEVETDTMLTYQFQDSSQRMTEDRRYITAHYWDSAEPCLLACETKTCDDETSKEEGEPREIVNGDDLKPLKESTSEVKKAKLVTLFVSKEMGIVVQDEQCMSSAYLNLLGIDVPYFMILKKSPLDTEACAERLLMNYFDEKSAKNESIRNAIIKFSFSLSIGNLDDAYKTISSINNVNVWSNLTKMCIKKKRLDVAQICLGNMNDARGVSMLRNVDSEAETEVKLAALAIHMDMLEEAEALYESVKRYDLLNKMYQNSNRWDEALRIAEKYDRIHLRNTYDAYGRYLETQGNNERAIMMFEKANTHRKRVPRLLLHNFAALDKYVQKSKDAILLKWYGQYAESTLNMELALKYYEEAKDYSSTVRILCYLENSEQAEAVVNSSNDPAACFQLAQHYEIRGQIENAVDFFIKSGVYTNAIRICKENGLDDKLWQISTMSGPREKLDIARYFENVDPYKSVMLYQKAENYHRALHLAFKYDLHDSVEMISAELDTSNHSDLLEKCAEYFMAKGIFESAIKLLASAKKYDEAIEICTKRRVLLSEETADLLIPPADHSNRMRTLNDLGEYTFFLGNYHLAARMFTQAGNKTKAMKALLKSGDTEKIIFFANVSREKDIYIMAANYLQTLDWHAEPDLLKHIVNFYTKGKASHLLANFYLACAQIEIDEYGDYEKSVGALNEASRCLSKEPDQYGQALEYIVKKIATVKKYLEMKRQFVKGESETAMSLARQLLNTEMDLVRRGDVYSLMIEHFTKRDDWNAAAQLIAEMKKQLPDDNLSWYIPKETLQKLGIEYSDPANDNSEKRPTTAYVDDIEDLTSNTN